jgi:hypothetical protein
MKKIILGTLVSVFLSTQIYADCNTLNFGPHIPTQKIKFFGSSEKETGQVVGYQAIYSTKGRFYRDSDGKLQLKTFNDAYGEFFNYVKATAFEECKTNNYQGIVNVDIKYVVDENNYFFTATYNNIN